MVLVLTFISLIFAVIASLQLSISPKIDSINRITNGYSPATTSIKNSFIIDNKNVNDGNETRTAAKNANIASIRLCRQLSYEMRLKYAAGDFSCSNYENSSVLYGFLGSVGTQGSIDTLYTGAMSSTLSCASPATVASYGRYVFSRALPQSLISGKNVSYNLIGITNGHGDPCGFHEIVN